MGHTTRINDYEYNRATTVGADDGGVPVEDEAAAPAKSKTKTKVVAADAEGVETK